MKYALAISLLLIGIASLAKAQDKYKAGEFKGFTINEPVIEKSGKEFDIRAIKGRIVFCNDSLPIKAALFEIKGPGDSTSIIAATTDKNGTFEIGNTPEGTYLFKASAVGYNAYAGRIIISKRTKQKSRLNICLQPGF
jgi:hypothetical protein